MISLRVHPCVFHADTKITIIEMTLFIENNDSILRECGQNECQAIIKRKNEPLISYF